MRIIFLSILLVLSSMVFSQEVQSYDEILQEFFEVSGQTSAADQFMAQLPMLYNESNPEQQTTEIGQLIQPMMDSLRQILPPIYKKYYSKEDLLSLIEFYRSPLGQKHVKSTQMIGFEVMREARIWATQYLEERISK